MEKFQNQKLQKQKREEHWMKRQRKDEDVEQEIKWRHLPSKQPVKYQKS